MNGKITLITPPDFFENQNLSILFVNLSNDNQDKISKFLAELNFDNNINFYVFNDETNVSWLLYAFNRCEYKFVDFNNSSNVISTMGSYLISKPNTFYSSSDKNLTAMFSHINQNKITDIQQFLERIFNDQTL